MANPYTAGYVAPYFAQLSPQDQQGLNPVFQNIAQQQANQNAALQQQNQQVQQAGQAFQQGGGMNPMAMAAALRKPQSGNSMYDTLSGYLGTQQSPQQQAEISQLGSNTWNPLSDYNRGTNGWGNYGE